MRTAQMRRRDPILLTRAIDNLTNDVFVVTCYDSKGRVEKVSNPVRSAGEPGCQSSLEWTVNGYDTAGRLETVTAPDSNAVTTTYGVATTGSQIGTVVTVSDQAGKVRRSITNALGHLIRVDEPIPGSTPLADMGSISSPAQPTIYGYDVLNNLLSVTQAGGNTAQCGTGNSSCSQTRTFEYDALSRLKQASNPESGTIDYEYDANSNLTRKDDARGVRTTYVYDALNRVTQRNYSVPGATPLNYQASPNVTYYYDDSIENAKGKLTKVENSVSTTEYTSFDILGRVTSSTQTTDGVTYGNGSTDREMTYVYNLAGQLVEQQYPSGRVVKNIIDANGDLSVVKSKKKHIAGYYNYAQHFTYAASGAVTSMQLGNGMWEKTVFNSRLQPEQIALGTTEGATDKLKLDYQYGDLDGSNNMISGSNNGNVAKQTITVPAAGATPGFIEVQNYDYDELNRIKSATGSLTPTGSSTPRLWTQEFKYDRFGNRNFESGTTTIPKNCTGNTTVCEEDRKIYNPAIDPNTNKLKTADGYAFDSGGNMKSDPQGRSFIYDSENKQVHIELIQQGFSQSAIGEYFYDGDGRRVKKKVYDGGVLSETIIFVYDAAGKQIAEYSSVIAEPEVAKVAYLTNDHLGSPRINTDRDGDVTSRHDYHPFGEEVMLHATSQGRLPGLGYEPDSVRKQFTGYERDAETGLDYAQARMHSAIAGRFTSVDPYNIVAEVLSQDNEATASRLLTDYIGQPQRWNRYAYVVNNPLLYTDPRGEDIVLTGTPDEQTAGLQRVAAILGADRMGLVNMKKKNGSLVLSVKPEKLSSFAAIGDNKENREFSAGMGNILVSSESVEFKVATTFDLKEGKKGDTKDCGGGCTVPSQDSTTGNVQIFVHPEAGIVATQAAKGYPDVSSDGRNLASTNETVDAHEFGHASSRLAPSVTPKRDPFRQETWIDSPDIVFENAIRTRVPGNPQRRARHDPR